jgi:hypothetical protein
MLILSKVYMLPFSSAVLLQVECRSWIAAMLLWCALVTLSNAAAFHPYGSIRATVMIDRKTGRSRGFGFVYLDHHDALHDAITEMHGAVLDGRKISVTRAVPETQTMPGTPAPLLAAGKGIRGGRGVRGSAWESGDGIRGSPRGYRGRGRRYDSISLH